MVTTPALTDWRLTRLPLPLTRTVQPAVFRARLACLAFRPTVLGAVQAAAGATAAPRSTVSQSGATTSAASAMTESVPTPQVIESTSPSRASTVSLP